MRIFFSCLVGLCATATLWGAEPLPVIWQATALTPFVRNSVALSPDNLYAASHGSNGIHIWRVEDGAPVRELSEHQWWLQSVAFSPSGEYLAAGGGDGYVRVWRTNDWSLVYSLSNANQGAAVAFSDDSSLLAVGFGREIQLRYATNGVLVNAWTGTVGKIEALAFGPKGILASGAGYRGMDTSVKLWTIPEGELSETIPTAHTYGIGSISFSPDRQMLAVGGLYIHSGPLQVFRLDGSLVRTFPENVNSAVFSSTGDMLVSVGTNVTFWSLRTGEIIRRYEEGPEQGFSGIALTSDTLRFARARRNGEICVGRVPLWINWAKYDGHFHALWIGGTGNYDVQYLTPTGWVSFGWGSFTNRGFSIDGGAQGLFRVVGLPNPQ